jgi:hypothetical protein
MDPKDPALPSLHSLGMWLDPDGHKFLMCTLCKIAFELPAGKSYQAIAEEFDSRPCVPMDEPFFAQ